MQTQNQSSGSEIKIYDSLWKWMLMFFFSLIFVSIGVFFIYKGKGSLELYGCIIFLGAGGIFILAYPLYCRIRKIPFLIIEDDCLAMYVYLKRSYRIIRFEDVKGFRLIKFYLVKNHSPQQHITIDYNRKVLSRKIKESETSWFKRILLKMSLSLAGTIDSILVDNLTMKADTILEILNERLSKFKENSKIKIEAASSEVLDR